MYKTNRHDGLCESSGTMFPVGIDVSKTVVAINGGNHYVSGVMHQDKFASTA